MKPFNQWILESTPVLESLPEPIGDALHIHTSEYSTLLNRRNGITHELTPEARADYNEFIDHYEDEGCYCAPHKQPHETPCDHCTHPGNPETLLQLDCAWTPVL